MDSYIRCGNFVGGVPYPFYPNPPTCPKGRGILSFGWHAVCYPPPANTIPARHLLPPPILPSPPSLPSPPMLPHYPYPYHRCNPYRQPIPHSIYTLPKLPYHPHPYWLPSCHNPYPLHNPPLATPNINYANTRPTPTLVLATLITYPMATLVLNLPILGVANTMVC